MQETEKIWMNGELVDWADATVHVGVHGLHYGTGVFEGIRAYETSKGPSVFRLADHLQRSVAQRRLTVLTPRRPVPHHVIDRLRRQQLALSGRVPGLGSPPSARR